MLIVQHLHHTNATGLCCRYKGVPCFTSHDRKSANKSPRCNAYASPWLKSTRISSKQHVYTDEVNVCAIGLLKDRDDGCVTTVLWAAVGCACARVHIAASNMRCRLRVLQDWCAQADNCHTTALVVTVNRPCQAQYIPAAAEIDICCTASLNHRAYIFLETAGLNDRRCLLTTIRHNVPYWHA